MKKDMCIYLTGLMALTALLGGCGKKITLEEETIISSTEQSAEIISEQPSTDDNTMDEVSIFQNDAVLTKPPVLKLHDMFSSNLDDAIVLLSGNYEWNYWVDQANDEMSGGIACGLAPLDEAKDAERHSLPDYAGKTSDGVAYSVSAEVQPSSLTVHEYYITELGDGEPEVLSEEQYESDFMLYLQPDRVYDITAEWDKDLLSVNGFYGRAGYVLVTGE